MLDVGTAEKGEIEKEDADAERKSLQIGRDNIELEPLSHSGLRAHQRSQPPPFPIRSSELPLAHQA